MSSPARWATASQSCALSVYLAERGTTRSPSDLATHNCLTFSYFDKSLDKSLELEDKGQDIAVCVRGNLSANESVVLLSACVEGSGISMQPQFCAEALLASHAPVAVSPQDRHSVTLAFFDFLRCVSKR